MMSKLVKKHKGNLNEEKVWFEWEAPERPFKKMDRDFWITAISILVLFSVILFFIKEFFLIMALISVLFLYYAMSTVAPRMIKNKITNRAVYTDDNWYIWDDLSRFYFNKRLNSEVLEFETKLRIPRQVTLVIDEADKERVKEIILKRLPLIKSPPNFMDKITKWFGERIPLEKREK